MVERTLFFYGWVILLAGSFGTIMSSPGQTYTISIFIEQFIMAPIGMAFFRSRPKRTMMGLMRTVSIVV